MTRGFIWLVITTAVLTAGTLMYQSAHSRITTQIYRDRLQALDHDYQQLRRTYNEAVRKTAATELIVQGDQLTVVIRTAEGVLERIPTPFDPTREIYVDYVVADGRLWIRRVFDAQTPPGRGLVIGPLHDAFDWSKQPRAYGKAVYRALTDGRWVITVTGDGSLGLAKIGHDTTVDLIQSPVVRDYERIEKDIGDRIDQISLGEVIRHMLPW